jgi:hypothetical protein
LGSCRNRVSFINPNFEIPPFAKAPALRKASGGGASRRQANVKGMAKSEMRNFIFFYFGFILTFELWHLTF